MTHDFGTVEFQLDDGAVEPKRGTAGSAGWDLSVATTETLAVVRAGEPPVVVDTGVRVAIPEGCVGLVIQRSSVAAEGLFCNLGVIDSDYRGTIKLLLWTASEPAHAVSPGARLAQLVVVPIADFGYVIHSLPPTARGEGGLGSTG